MARPLETDYAPYYDRYISLVQETDIKSVFASSLKEIQFFLSLIPADKSDYAYAPNKWTVKQVLQHVTDVERIFAYRALCIGRGEQKPLPGFEQDEYAEGADLSHRSLGELKDELLTVRQTSVHLFQSFTEQMLNSKGLASNKPITALSCGYVITGHWRHHERLFKDKYGIV